MLEIKNYKTIFDKYEFMSKLDKIKGNEDLIGNMSKVYVLSERPKGGDDDDEQSKQYYICKRIRGDKYNENEWKLTTSINSKDDRVICFTDIYHRSKEESSFHEYYYLISPFNGEQDFFSYYSDLEFPKDIIPENVLQEYLLEMALCLRDCHDANIAHLDVKTENFIVTSEKPLKLKLIDFGFSVKLSSPNDYKKLKKVIGTPFYVAPEIDEHKACYLASDVFSLGAIIIFLTNIFDRSDDIHFQYKKFKRMKYYSEAFKQLVAKLLIKDPRKRITINGIIDTLNKMKEKPTIIEIA